ncbi:glycoside hydrolase family 127 protein [Demequina sp. NBRC 110054]|uniref:glycoside hydrolase family 127 protein n=1 Tax=Demequina sp. NBRC 110054 TaxID=1570343 RepID=UPI000A077A14|nr:beta-L-arabinofuranosidase domain-containing protein [Demequina sp. NBRC 110054]
MTETFARGDSLASDARRLARPVVPSRGTRRGAGLGEVTWGPEGYWGSRQRVNAEATIAHCEAWMERLGWLENFDRVARGDVTIERAGWEFSDSELYKLLEGVAWELGREHDAELQARFDALVARIAAAQDDDGYLDTAFGHPGLPPRYSDMAMGHELYNVGHLLQAAVARLRTGHDDLLVEVARRAADHVCRVFGIGGQETLCGHPEIEVGLAEFGRATGERRYLDQAGLFLDRRGHGTLPVRPLLSAEYFQDDTPVRDATAFRGHAVRALYLASGAVDVAVDTGDDDLLAALTAQWEHTVSRRTYLTGGMGSRHQDEGFGDDWELPPDRAYCETCAGIGSTMLAWRLLLATGEVRYADLMERTLYNVVAVAPDATGTAFFYANPLQVRVPGGEFSGEGVNMRAEGGVRAPWFDVSCCPTNVTRMFASLHTYAAFVEGDEVSLVLYGAGELSFELESGRMRLRVETRYPDDGAITVTVVEAPSSPVTLRLRVPAWAEGSTGTTSEGVETLETGWWRPGAVREGDVVSLMVDTEPRLTWPDPRIDAMRGTVAVERGPLVLCVESTDLPDGVGIEDVRLDSGVLPLAEGDGAIATMRARVGVEERGALPFSRSADRAHAEERVLRVPLVPYHRWGERAPSQMRVMIPEVATSRRGA